MIRINDDNKTDPEIGNLSLNQVHRLTNLPWNDPDYPIKFNKELIHSDIKESVFFANTTIFLKTLIEMEKENTATAKGNLNRKFVKAVFDKLVLDSDVKKDILKFNKVINEEDVLTLNVIRIVCEEAKLVQCRKKKFIITAKARKLISDNNIGEFFYELFHTYFTKFNIGFVDRLPALDIIQHTVGYSFCRLSRIAGEFRDVGELFDEIFLPDVKEEIRKILPPALKYEWLVQSRIVRPLIEFGLLEGREKKGRIVGAVRKTELFGRFVRVEW